MAQSNLVVTHIIESSRSSSSGTSIFKIPMGVFKTGSAVLCGLGATNATATSRYPNNVGAGICIRSMRLRSSATELDSYDSKEALQLLAVRCMSASNSAKNCLSRVSRRDAWSWKQEALIGRSSGPDGVEKYAGRFILDDPLNTAAGTTSLALTNDSSTTPLGNVPLSDFLGICQSMPVLPGIPELVLEVTYVTDAGLYNSATPSTIVEPFLVIQEVTGIQLPKTSSYLYSQWIRESFSIPSAANGVVVTTSLPSKAFLNRTCKRFVWANQVATQAVGTTRKILGTTGSRAMALESLSVNANYGTGARDVFPAGGCYSKGLKQFYFYDTMGLCVLPKFGYNYDLTNKTTVANANDGLVLPEIYDNLIGQTSFGAFSLGGPVSTMKMTFTRTGDNVSTLADVAVLNSAYTVNLFGETISRMDIDRLSGKLAVSH